ncbi:sugar transporter [Clostridium beijerinckii]|uniref:Sugar transporter n=1 Tax=Clostridium beijerinckii TaxID=1520 RepID=A0A0B5QR91_CLOBE|nr:glycoside-pentoside-hexuronide (GPH):cation symporter [Clostridium beijerinckii]AJH00782.1 sugar transporter [Clostridium beijerinckii]
MKEFGLRDKIGYMFGDLGNDFFFSFVSAFLMLFYTDVMGIGGAIVGLIFLLARIWDAFMDVAWGRFIDSRPVGKNGKFKPWMIRMSFPLVIFGVLMFTKFPGMSNNFQLVYAFATYIIWGSLYSTVNIPYGSMASVITRDATERGSLSTFRTIGASLAGIVINVVVPIFIFVNNKADAGRFSIIAIGFAILAMCCYSLCYFLTTERIISQGEEKKIYWKVTIAGIKRNKPLIAFVITALIVLISGSFSTSMNAYLFKDYFHNAKALAIAGVILKTCPIVLAPFIAPMIRRFGKKEAVCVSMLVAAIADFALFLIPTRNTELYLAIYTISSLGLGVFGITIWAFVTDVIDYQEYLTDTREEGTIYAIYSFARKIGQALAGGISGIALGFIGYVGGVAAQTPQVEVGIKNFTTLIPAIANLVVFLILAFLYPLGKDKLAQLTKELEDRRLTKAENAAIIKNQK